MQTDSNVAFQSNSLLLAEFTTKFLPVFSILILFPRNFSKVLHSLTNCTKGTSEILYDKFTYFAEHSTHYFILNFVFLHTQGIFSKTCNLLGENIWMSSKHWVRFLLNAVTEVLYDSLSPSTTFSLTLFGDSETFWHTTVFLQAQWYMKNLLLPSVFHEYWFLAQHCTFRLSTVSHFKPTQ